MSTYQLQERRFRNVVVGSGAAGFNAAARLHQFGETDTVLITENVHFGTSRNTGSDKQTYYKLSLAGRDEDSVLQLAEDLFAGRCVDGDQALCEAALSTQCFYHLVELGVPFPCNEYGEFVGYKTDHDHGRRATSVGPYTSKVMTERLEADVRSRGITILDGMQAIHLFVQDKRVQAVLCLNLQETKVRQQACYELIYCNNCILATGGPAGMYHDSVYPQSQIGSSGMAFEAGVLGKNLTEWQYGMASLQPRWNVSGTYMQVLPRVVSTAEDGSDEREFLLDFFQDPGRMQSLLFLKGYQWPFDTNKIFGGSSMIDLLVYQERCIKGRRVYLDYRSNSQGQVVDFSQLSEEAYTYLENAGALFGTPIERLARMNQPAIDFYREHGVDLYHEMLEIAICAQHNNGGLSTDAHWETNIRGLYAVGEVCGSHGVTRPGGTALNAGQVGSYRAAAHIAWNAKHDQQDCCADPQDLREQTEEYIEEMSVCSGTRTIAEIWDHASRRMSRDAGMIRDKGHLLTALVEARQDYDTLQQTVATLDYKQLPAYYHLRDMLLSQVVYISSMLNYVESGAGSRGSALYTDPDGTRPDPQMPEMFTCQLDNGGHDGVTQEMRYSDVDGVIANWRPVRPIPELDYFFENVWSEYRARMM